MNVRKVAMENYHKYKSWLEQYNRNIESNKGKSLKGDCE